MFPAFSNYCFIDKTSTTDRVGVSFFTWRNCKFSKYKKHPLSH